MKAKQVLMANLIVLAVAATQVSCVRHLESLPFSDGKTVTEVRNIRNFEKIEINGSPSVYYTQADTFSVKVKGPESLIEEIITEREGETLKIRNRGKVGVFNFSFDGGESAAVYVTSPDLIDVRLNGSGDFVCDRRLDTDNIKLVVRGSGDLSVTDLISDRCDVELVGSGDIHIENLEAKEVSAVLIGSGDIDLNLRNVADTRLALKGSGDIDAVFEEGCQSVDCELNGSGDIDLKGRIGQIKSKKRGSGDINIANLTIEK